MVYIITDTYIVKIIIFTSNAIRHKYVANALTAYAEEALVISEVKPHDAPPKTEVLPLIDEHFQLRYETEAKFFAGNDYFASTNTLPIVHKEVNLPYVCDVVRKFNPDMAFAFGSWIIKEPLLSLIPEKKFINLHLGMSPYYRGTATNFWPFVNKELEYVGSTILHINAGIDTGDIITHVQPRFESGDTVHTIGCKVIQESVKMLLRVMTAVREGKKLPQIPQWKVEHEHFYKGADFNEGVLRQYYENLHAGIVDEYLKNPRHVPRLIAPL